MSNKTKTFLQKYMNGPKDKAIYEQLKNGFLRLQYDCEGEIEEVCFVSKRGEKPNSNQLQLYFMMCNDMVTFKTELSLSGSYWSNGYVDVGTVFDDDLGGGPGKKYDLDVWINECLREMCSSN